MEETMTRSKTFPLVLVTVFLTLVVCAQPGAPGMCSRLSFVAVGDALIHQGVYNAARADDGAFDFSPMLRLVKDRIARHDLAFYNQETILGGVELGLSTYPCFNSPREVGDAFLDTGFNLVSLANNHTLDRRENGVLRSLEYWSEKESVLTAGSYSTHEDRDEIRTVEVNGITCAFLAYTTLTNGLRPPEGKAYYVNVYDPEKVRMDVEKARAVADVIIVSMHWGSEYVFTPTKAQTEIAGRLADSDHMLRLLFLHLGRGRDVDGIVFLDIGCESAVDCGVILEDRFCHHVEWDYHVAPQWRATGIVQEGPGDVLETDLHAVRRLGLDHVQGDK